MEILSELGELYEQQKRFLMPYQTAEPLVMSQRELAEYLKRSEKIRVLNEELPKAIEEMNDEK